MPFRPQQFAIRELPADRPCDEENRLFSRRRRSDYKCFEVIGGLAYTEPDGTQWNVEAATPTDLATIPFVARWFASPYGAHAAAAIVHDHLVRPPFGVAGKARDRAHADDVFLTAMGDADRRVPLFRRWIIYSAVTMFTRLKHSGVRSRLMMILWLVGAAVGTGAVVWGVSRGEYGMAAAALAAPIPGAVLWGRRFAAGVVFGYGMILLVVPSIFAGLAYGVYWLIEWTLRIVIGLFTPRRMSELPRPTPYGRF